MLIKIKKTKTNKQKKSLYCYVVMIVNNLLWVRKKPAILTFEHAPGGKPV